MIVSLLSRSKSSVDSCTLYTDSLNCSPTSLAISFSILIVKSSRLNSSSDYDSIYGIILSANALPKCLKAFNGESSYSGAYSFSNSLAVSSSTTMLDG